jgi:hypothetical protein
MSVQVSSKGGKVVTVGGTKYVAVWNRDMIVVCDENQVIKANGVLSQQLKLIDDVMPGTNCIWVFGQVEITGNAHGVVKLSTVSWQVEGSLIYR